MSALRLASTSLNEAPEQQHTMPSRDRRVHRRHDLEQQDIAIDRWEGTARVGRAASLGRIVDLSAGGVRIRTTQPLKPDHQVRVRLELPDFAGICPFVDTATGEPRPTRHWVGWMAVTRVQRAAGSGREFDVAGRLIDMEDLDRGMLGLYLSTQPLAA